MRMKGRERSAGISGGIPPAAFAAGAIVAALAAAGAAAPAPRPAPGAVAAPAKAVAAPAGAAPAAGDASRFQVRLPGKDWALAIDLPGFLVERQDTRPDGATAMLMARQDQNDMSVFVYVTREPNYRSADECKRHYWALTASSPFRKDDVHEVAKGEMVTVHFVIPELQGRTIQQKNVIAYLYRDGACIDVHVSKGMYDRADEPLFTAILDSVRIAAAD